MKLKSVCAKKCWRTPKRESKMDNVETSAKIKKTQHIKL
jgi:hypothetical protein